MKIVTMGNGPWPEHSRSGSEVTVEGLIVDCQAEAGSSQVVIDVCVNAAGQVVRGVAAGSAYLASLTLPPVRTREELIGEDVRQIVEPLDMSRVELKLWAFERPAEQGGEEL
jgi:hypothetical protein